MATIVTIQAADQITNSRADLNTNFANLNSDKIETSYLDTDTSLAANSDTKIATQKAVKAYVDTGGNVNASTTAKGIVEEATAAEVLAGTAAGATSARLFMNPSAQAPGVIKSVTAGATISGATLPVPVYQKTSDNEFYACDANDTAAMKFIGFAVSNGTDGATFRVQFTGVVSGFSGLDEGVAYYVSDTVGTIQNTPGTYAIKVGVAISTTELFIQPGARYRNGTASLTDGGADESTQTVAIDLGFRPAVIRMTATTEYDAAGEQLNFAIGTWINAVYASHQFYQNSTNSGADTVSTSLILQSFQSGTAYWELTITNVTATGFTISALQKDITPPALNLTWEAQGDL